MVLPLGLFSSQQSEHDQRAAPLALNQLVCDGCRCSFSSWRVSDAPAVPTNISCIYKVQTNESGTVLCSWDRGRDTYLTTSSSLWWVWDVSAPPNHPPSVV